MSIELMKQMVDELEYVLDCINQDKIPFDGDDFHERSEEHTSELQSH